MTKTRSPGMLISFLWILVFFTVSACGEDKPNVDEIVSKFIQKLKIDSAYVGNNYTHEEWETSNEIKDGIVARKEDKIYFIIKQDGGLFRKLVSKNGIPPNKSKFEKKEEIVPFNDAFFQRYTYTFKRIETLNGYRCWVLSFSPKPDLVEDKKKDRILNNLYGEVWISQNTLEFKKIVALLSRGVIFAWPGFVGGEITKLECNVLGVSIDGHSAVGFVRAEYAYAGRALFFPITGHSVVTIEYKNYERRTK